ncbi:hypothetical protein ACFC18_35135 [Streptomyces sp. NPDC056121]|uniref:hypothetical protein n=1 Tax=unclassified Streptomyces TaxID=2593676 RepID=UPI003255F7F2
MEPEAVTTPVITSQYPLRVPADPTAPQVARIKGRTALTMLSWPGSHLDAVEVLGVLVTNALEHGITPGDTKELHACLSVTETRELLIDVTDHNPMFRDFERAIAGEVGQGLWRAGQLGASISQYTAPDFSSKTVRAVMRPLRRVDP